MVANQTPKINRYRIEAVDRALQLLDVLAGAPGATAAQLATKMDANRSLVFRMLSTLADRGFVSKDIHNAYRLGPRLVSLAEQAASGDLIVEASRKVMDQLLQDTQESLYLVVPDGIDVLCVATRTSPQKMRLVSDVGFRRKMGVGSSALVFMAFAPPEFVEAVLGYNYADGGPPTMRPKGDVEKLLPGVRRDGYHETMTDEADIYTISSPIWDWRDEIAAVMVLDAPLNRVPPDRAALIRADLLAATDEITAMLGGTRRFS